MTAMLVAERLRGVEASATLALAAKAKALKQSGKPVLDFTAGEPDFPTPQAVKDAGVKAIEQNRTKYTPAGGIPELRSAIATFLSRRLGVTYESSQIIVSCGAKHVLYNACQALCQGGDEVIIFSPFWISYVPMVQLAGGKPVLVHTSEAQRYQPDLKALGAAITPRTKAIILNSPSNPTGMLIDRQRLVGVATLALERNLAVISDEIYDQLVYPPNDYASILQVEPRLTGQTLIVNGASKTYSMTGWRIGYAAGPKYVIQAMDTLQSHSTSNPASISQYAALEAISGDQRPVAAMRAEFQQRRDRLVNGLNAIPKLSCLMPQGAFYAWCNVSQLQQSAEAISARWLEDSLVAVVPGEGFGSNDHVRFSFAASMDVIDEGLARLTQWVSKH